MSVSPSTTAESFAPRLALFYATLFAAAGIHQPFFPIWLAAKGLDAGAIGLVLAAPMIVRIAAVPLATREADRRAALRPALVIASFASAAGMALVGFAEGAAAILIAFTLASIAWAPVMPLTDAYALKRLNLTSYGPVRLWGSAAFIAGSIGAGWLADIDSRAASDLDDRGSNGRNRCCRAGGAAASSRAGAPGQPQATGKSAVYPGLRRGDRGVEPRAGEPCGLLRLLRYRLEGGRPRRHDHRRAVGARGPGRDRAVCVCGPAARGDQSDNAAGDRRRRGGHPLGAMAFDPSAPALAFLQCLHGLSFGATHLGAMGFIARAAPPQLSATAQGCLATAYGIVMAAATGAAGLLYGAQGSMAYGAMVLPAAAGGVSALAAHRLMRRGLAG